MLGIDPISGSGEGYYIEAVAQGVDEYYRGVGEAPGWWAGTAAEVELCLDGEVGSDDLRAVWSGLDPRNGEQLGRFTNRTVGGFDLLLAGTEVGLAPVRVRLTRGVAGRPRGA